jgi:hypothetical protein
MNAAAHLLLLQLQYNASRQVWAYIKFASFASHVEGLQQASKLAYEASSSCTESRSA